jgi:hypothetical protein
MNLTQLEKQKIGERNVFMKGFEAGINHAKKVEKREVNICQQGEICETCIKANNGKVCFNAKT